MNGKQNREYHADGTVVCNPEVEQGWSQVASARAKQNQILQRAYAEEKLRRETAEKEIASLRALLAAARRDRESWAAIDDQRCAELRKAEQERDRANSDVADACNRLQTIVDEAWGQQPVLSLDNLLSIVEREAFKDRQRCEQMRAVWAPVFEAANDLNTLGWCGAGCDALLRAATKAAKEIAALPACPGPAEPSVLAAGPDKYDGGERTYAEYRANVERLFPNAESYHVPARFVEPTEPTCDADPALYGNAPSEAAPQRTCGDCHLPIPCVGLVFDFGKPRPAGEGDSK